MSTLKVNTIQNTSGVTQYMAKAWVNFNGTGTVAIRASGNVSSINDNGTGNYTVNFTTAMSDVNYAAQATVGITGSTPAGINIHTATLSTGSLIVTTSSSAHSLADYNTVAVTIFR